MKEPVTTGSLPAEVEEGLLQRALDQVSLEQSLRDFDIANARVIDLTRRLVASERRVVTLQQQLDENTQALQELRATHEAMRSSAAYRIATRIWTLRNALGV
jgi:hypothetical protein